MQVPPCVLIVEDRAIFAFELACADAGSRRPLARQERHARNRADGCVLEGGREGIETARWLREMCGAEVVFVTAYTDAKTLERIHERVPGAQVLSKPVATSASKKP
jgi:hypothetical protein